MIKMNVAGLTIDPFTNTPIVLLRDESGDKTLPIWIGLLEATAIASELESIKFSRPMTHDLFKSVMDELGTRVRQVEVCDLKDNTFFAILRFERDGKEVAVDARPSDAIALALRTEAPIFVAERVLEVARHMDSQGRPQDETEEGKKWTELLESLSPDDFGKYKM